MQQFTEQQVTVQLHKMLQTTSPQSTLDLVSAEAMHILNKTVVNASMCGVQEVQAQLPIDAAEAVMIAIATLAFGLGVECGIELHSTDEFTKQFGDTNE